MAITPAGVTINIGAITKAVSRHTLGEVVAVEPFTMDENFSRAKVVEGLYSLHELMTRAKALRIPVEAELINARDVHNDLRRGVLRIYPGGRTEHYPHDWLCLACGERNRGLRAPHAARACKRCGGHR